MEATTRPNKTDAFILVRRPAARGGVVGLERRILFQNQARELNSLETRNLFAQDDASHPPFLGKDKRQFN